jgi:hypothetical protein
MTIALVLFHGAMLAIAMDSPAYAHSWYPMECCSAQDCMPADEIVVTSGEARITRVGDQQIAIPSSLVPRSSPDGRIHVCFRVVAGDLNGAPTLLPFCLFLPAQS